MANNFTEKTETNTKTLDLTLYAKFSCLPWDIESLLTEELNNCPLLSCWNFGKGRSPQDWFITNEQRIAFAGVRDQVVLISVKAKLNKRIPIMKAHVDIRCRFSEIIYSGEAGLLDLELTIS